MAGGSFSKRRAGASTGLLRTGGGDRNLGETGHLGVSLKFSTAVGDDFWGIDPLPLEVEGAGSLGVVAADRVLLEGAEVGPLDLKDRAGLRSCWLFLRDLVPGAEEAVGLRGRDGEGSREGLGEGTVDDAAEL